MSKPTWDSAPSWARWLAQDRDGGWGWFEFKPEWGCGMYAPKAGRYIRARHAPKGKGALERRP